MNIKVIKTRKFLPPNDDLWTVLKESIPALHENSVVAITSKVVSIGEGRCTLIEKVKSKEELIKSQSDLYLPKENDNKHRIHTITNGILVGSSGIDESNSNGYYILWPKDPDLSARKIWKFLRDEYKIKNLGVIITDSNAVVMKRGIVGQAIAYYGFVHIKNYVGKKDLFGRKFKYSRSNLPDSLAAFAVFLMGEGNEQTPIVIFEDLPRIQYVTRTPHYQKRFMSWKVNIDEDIYRPFLKAVRWKAGGKK